MIRREMSKKDAERGIYALNQLIRHTTLELMAVIRAKRDGETCYYGLMSIDHAVRYYQERISFYKQRLQEIQGANHV